MLFWKKLCRLNGGESSSSSSQQQQQQQQQRRHHDRNLRENFRTISSSSAVLEAVRSYEELSTLEISARHNNNDNDHHHHHQSNDENIQRSRLAFRRTPPPVYNPHLLPATPPPSYSPRRPEEPLSIPIQITAAAAAPIRVTPQQLTAATSSNFIPNRPSRPHLELISRRINENASGGGSQQAQAAAAVRQQRRRRLQQLEQQRFANILSISSTDSSTSSDSEGPALNQQHPHQYQQRRGRSRQPKQQQQQQQQHRRRLKGAYCPDLLHACSLILHHHQQPATSDSSVGNFTATPSPPPPPAAAAAPTTDFDYSSDYVEIDELLPIVRQIHEQRNQNILTKSTPDLGPSQDYNGNYHRLECNSNSNLCKIAMGQNLSLRRPRISLTWVLREQQQQTQQQQQSPTDEQQNEKDQLTSLPPPPPTSIPPPLTSNGTLEKSAHNNNNGILNGGHDGNGLLELKHRTEAVPTQLNVTKKRYRVKQQLPGCNEPLNGYATTPTAHLAPNNSVSLAPQKFFSNQNLLEYKDKTRRGSSSTHGGGGGSTNHQTKELLFVCTPQRAPKYFAGNDGGGGNEALVLARKRNELRKKMAATKMVTNSTTTKLDADNISRTSLATSTTHVPSVKLKANGSTTTSNIMLLTRDSEAQKSLKGTYSEPSLIAASEGGCGGGSLHPQLRRHRHRKRRERSRVQKFGYEIHNVDEFLSKCSLAAPGNIPVVLATASTMYQTRPGGYQLEIPLPLGMVVNAVFKNENWLYVQTPHAEEGYVGYASCLPLGILPPAARGHAKHTPCWESNVDVFPRPCGNMTDSEKEIRLRGGTRSDGARTPRLKGSEAELNGGGGGQQLGAVNNNNHTPQSQSGGGGGEQHVDKLYLRAASQPKLVEKAYAQLRSTKQATASIRSSSQDEYVTLLQQQKSKLHIQKHLQQQQQQQQQQQPQQIKRLSNGASYITNGHNGQHLHPKITANGGGASNSHQQQSQQQSQQQPQPQQQVLSIPQTMMHAVRRQQQHQQGAGLRQTLVAINADFITESITVHKGEIVTLCECRESKDHRQWFYVRTRDGREGFIPAEVAGHGYL